MCARRLTHPAAASFEPGASARFATSANSTRSVRGSRLRPASSRVMTVSIPSRRHNASRTSVPPTGRDEVNANPSDPAVVVPVRAVAGSSSRVSDADQPLDRVAVELVLAAEAVQHLRPRGLRDRVPLVVGQLQVPHRGAVLVSPRRHPYVHVSRRYTTSSSSTVRTSIERVSSTFAASGPTATR